MTGDATGLDMTRYTPRFLLGMLLVFGQFLALLPYNILHEGGHAVTHLLRGETIYGFYVSFWGGQVLADYAPGSSWGGFFTDVGGYLVTLPLAYALVSLQLRRGRFLPFVIETLILLSLSWLLIDGFYLSAGSFVHFGDGYQASRQLGLPSWAMALATLPIAALNGYLLYRLWRDWSRRFLTGNKRWLSASVVLAFGFTYLVVCGIAGIVGWV